MGMLSNPRREKFCQIYAREGNAYRAYKGAGYNPNSEDSAYKAASRLLSFVEVQERIRELTEEARKLAEKRSIADITEIRQIMTQIVRGEIPDAKSADRVRASEFLAKIGGQMEPERVRVELSLSDKLARIQQLLHDGDS